MSTTEIDVVITLSSEVGFVFIGITDAEITSNGTIDASDVVIENDFGTDNKLTVTITFQETL